MSKLSVGANRPRAAHPILPVALAAFLFLTVFGFSAEPSLSILNAGVQSSEDAPFVAAKYQFLPGDYLYFTFQVAGFGVKSDEQAGTRKISLAYSVVPEDSNGVNLTIPVSDTIQAELNPEDKNWTPKRRVSFLLPSFAAAGEYRVHVALKDLLANTEVAKDFPFNIGGTHIQRSSTLIVENFQFFRREDDREPLKVSAYSAGDTVYARFDMVGYKTAPGNQYHLAYGVVVLRPDGKPFLQQPNAAELQAGSFYPAQFVPGTLNLITSPGSPHGAYVVVLTVRDLISNQIYETKQAFSIE